MDRNKFLPYIKLYMKAGKYCDSFSNHDMSDVYDSNPIPNDWRSMIKMGYAIIENGTSYAFTDKFIDEVINGITE